MRYRSTSAIDKVSKVYLNLVLLLKNSTGPSQTPQTPLKKIIHLMKENKTITAESN